MYNESIQQFVKMLGNLSAFIDKAVQHAESKKCDVTNLLNARLVADQFNFIRQVLSACDGPKLAAARLTGKEAPKYEDTETTVEQLKTRINNTVDYLKSFTDSDFVGCDDKKIELPFRPGLYVLGKDYFLEFVTPNFYFHVTTAYAILRANGVDIGKTDYIGHVDFKKIEG